MGAWAWGFGTRYNTAVAPVGVFVGLLGKIRYDMKPRVVASPVVLDASPLVRYDKVLDPSLQQKRCSLYHAERSPFHSPTLAGSSWSDSSLRSISFPASLVLFQIVTPRRTPRTPTDRLRHPQPRSGQSRSGEIAAGEERGRAACR